MNQINEEDKQLFRATVDTTPIDKDGGQYTNKTEKQPLFTAYNVVIDGTIASEKVVSYAQNGISKKIINRMKNGHIGSISTVDLHGYERQEACEKLSQFIYHHQFEQFVHIIHGKGYQSENGISILKTQVVNFLKQHPQVLAYHSCPQKEGGTGAVFALLKKQPSVAL